ncbi:MAG TPA: alpha/beta hydrolase [Ktedonobacteraceae bacterium]
MSEHVQKGIAEVNGTTLYYEVAGEGHPLVLNHGGLVDNHLWDDQFDEFAQHFKVIRYDIRGFGDSGMLKSGMEPYSMERDLYSLLQFLGIEKTYVLGLSMGGSLAIDFTLQYPEMVDALITVGAGLSGLELSDPDELKAQFAAMEEAFKSGDIARSVEISLQIWTDGPDRAPEQVDPQVRERVRAMTTRNFERGDDEEVHPQHMEPPAAGRLSEIHVPTLIIVGDKDVELILTIADALETGIAGAKKVVIPGTAHHLNMEKPQEFNRVVIEFLERLGKSR